MIGFQICIFCQIPLLSSRAYILIQKEISGGCHYWYLLILDPAIRTHHYALWFYFLNISKIWPCHSESTKVLTLEMLGLTLNQATNLSLDFWWCHNWFSYISCPSPIHCPDELLKWSCYRSFSTTLEGKATFTSINKLKLLRDPVAEGPGKFSLRSYSRFRSGRPESDSSSSSTKFIGQVVLSKLYLKASCSSLMCKIGTTVVFSLQMVVSIQWDNSHKDISSVRHEVVKITLKLAKDSPLCLLPTLIASSAWPHPQELSLWFFWSWFIWSTFGRHPTLQNWDLGFCYNANPIHLYP